jgi:hypothetical protein
MEYPLTKKCCICKIEKPLSDFGKDRQSKYGVNSRCHVCDAQRQKEYHTTPKSKEYIRHYSAEHRAELNRKQNERNKGIRLATITAYGGECACCGERILEFLAIDHINGGGNQQKRDTGMHGGSNIYRFLRRNGWPDGYRVLCHNCNMSKGIYGYCPHEKAKEDYSI